MSDLSGRVAFVTGASRGIGAGIARALAAAGATVAVNYRENEAAAAGGVAEITAAGGQAQLARADVRDAAAITTAVRQVAEGAGPISILVHNAGARLQP